MRRPIWPWAAALAMAGAVCAQQQIIGGHALDANQMIGSGGLNTRVNPSETLSYARYTSANTTPMYRNQPPSANTTALYRNQTNSGAGLTRQAYWVQQPAPSTVGNQPSAGYQQPSQFASRGPAYNTLSISMYKASSASAQVQVGTSGGYISAYAPAGVTATRYSALR